MEQGSSAPAAMPANQPAESSAPENTSEQLLDGETIDEGSSESGEQTAAQTNPKVEAKVEKAADKVDAEKTKAGKYKVKVDGEEVELSQDELIKYAQLGKAGQKRMAEAAQIKKDAQELVRMLRENPESVLADPAVLGSDEEVVKLAQKILSRKLEDEQKSPELREKERLEKELEQLRKEAKEREERQQTEEYERLVQQQEAQIEEQITEALETSGMPKSPFILKRLADVMLAAAENEKDISPKQAMNIVKREMQKDLREYIEAMQEDALEEIVSAEKVKKLRQRQLSKLKAEQAKAAPAPTEVKETASAPAPESKKHKISMKDFIRNSR
jgi:hypothetical protein